MYPAFTDPMARARVEDLHRAASRERLAARIKRDEAPSRLRSAVGEQLVRTGLRLLRTA